jgi:hypothetical protein
MPIDSYEAQFSNRKLAIGNDVAGMTRLELANQLIENQSAFHFAFIPKALLISDCQLPIGLMSKSWFQFCNWKLGIGNVSGARGEIRTHHKAGLKSAASSNWATTNGGPRAWLRRQDLNLRRRIMSPSLAALRLQCTPRQLLKLATRSGHSSQPVLRTTETKIASDLLRQGSPTG